MDKRNSILQDIVIAQPEFELTYFDVTLLHISHYGMGIGLPLQ